MVRAQIQLTESQYRRLRRLGAEEGVSLAEIIRRSVDSTLAANDRGSRTDLYERAAAMVGKFADRDEAADLSARHDDYLESVFR